jgi:hypothetical protein
MTGYECKKCGTLWTELALRIAKEIAAMDANEEE